MVQSYRLARGGRIDRSKQITMRFNGVGVDALAGDTVASALLANGIAFVGRSFKYHRPRGIFSHGTEEPNALLSVDRGGGRIDPNNRATCLEAVSGLSLHSQNHWPSLDFDVGAVNGALSPIFVAGFYYKTFMWPRSFWNKVYEPAIRAAAGLGRAPAGPDPDRYQHAHAHCDVLIVGAGPAGMAAALAASETGKRVMLVDEQAEMGGALLHDKSSTIDGRSAWIWIEESLARLASRDNVTLLPRTTAFGYYNHNHLGLVERVTDHLAIPPPDAPRERLWQVRATQVVLATGAHERPLVFPGNDRPGIMLAESLRVFANRYAVVPGQRAVIVTSGASAYTVAADLEAAGVKVTIVDVRSYNDCAVEAAALRGAGCEVLAGHTVVGSLGRNRVSGLIVAPVDASGSVGAHRTLPCDCVGLSGGWTPAVHLFSQSRGKLAFDADLDAFIPDDSVQEERSAGAARGTFQLSGCLAEGWRAGAAAAGIAKERRFTASAVRTGFQPVRVLAAASAKGRGRAFVDLQNDVTAKDIGLALREGFEFDRAREALHHHRHGDGPGQDVEHECPRPRGGVARQARAGGRHHDIPVAVYTRHLRRAGGAEPGCAVRSGAHDADPRLGRLHTGRRSRTLACGSAPAASRRAARTCTPPSTANARPCARARAFSTLPRSARSRSWARTQPSS